MFFNKKILPRLIGARAKIIRDDSRKKIYAGLSGYLKKLITALKKIKLFCAEFTERMSGILEASAKIKFLNFFNLSANTVHF